MAALVGCLRRESTLLPASPAAQASAAPGSLRR